MANVREIPKLIVRGYNNTGSTIPAHRAVKRTSVDRDAIALPGAADDPVLGVTMHEIANGEDGDVVVHGVAIVLNAGGVTQGGRLGVDTSGRAVTFAAGGGVNASVLGISEKTGANGELVEVVLAGPGASRQG